MFKKKKLITWKFSDSMKSHANFHFSNVRSSLGVSLLGEIPLSERDL